jgi:hypothetical protein
MRAEHLEFLVEEPSIEAFLSELLPRLFGDRATFTIHAHQGKSDLLGKIGDRLRGYAKWMPEAWRIVIVVDRDNDDCQALKQQMEQAATEAGLGTRTASSGATWRVVNRIAVEELEAWFFGDWPDLFRHLDSAIAPVEAPGRIRRQRSSRFPLSVLCRYLERPRSGTVPIVLSAHPSGPRFGVGSLTGLEWRRVSN